MILLDRITKTYPDDERPVLDNISLHIDPREFVFLVGKSGAGKSTLIKMITKEEVPDSGKILVGGIDLDYVRRRHIPHYRRRLGVVFQDYKLLPSRTVFENVAFALEIAGVSNREIQKTVPKVLDLVGLEAKANKFPSHLSGGEKQRVAIARSVARQPKILIADEPTANLDVLTRREIVDLLQKINDLGTTLLVATHNESIVNNLSKRVITLKGGRIISDQKVHGEYRLDDSGRNFTESPSGILRPEPEIRIVTPTPVIQKVYSSSQSQNKASAAQTNTKTPKNPTIRTATAPNLRTKPSHAPVKKTVIARSSVKTAANPSASTRPATPAKPATPPKKYERDSANQWYAASKPLRAAPKLSKLSPAQTVKLKPAPSIKQVAKRPLNKTKIKRVV